VAEQRYPAVLAVIGDGGAAASRQTFVGQVDAVATNRLRDMVSRGAEPPVPAPLDGFVDVFFADSTEDSGVHSVINLGVSALASLEVWIIRL